MPYDTVGDVLERARAFHRELGSFYRRMEDRADKERVRLVLDYLGRHEEHMDRCIRDYEKEAGKQVMEAWYKYTPLPDLTERIRAAQLTPEMTVNELIQVALRFDEALVELYRGMAEKATSAEVRDLFSKLLALEEKEERQLVRDAAEMQDL